MRTRHLLLAPLLVTIGSLAHGQSTRPADRPSIFRCVLDGNARMIVASLGSDVYAAYDANRCTLAKLWRGEVVLTGPVYDNRHGPQPKSAGQQLLDRPINLAPNPVAPATQPTDYANVNGYLGYSVRNGHSTLHFAFDGVKVDETLTLVDADMRTVVVRRTLVIRGDVSGDRAYAIGVPTSAAVRKVRLVEGSVTNDGKPVEQPGEVAYDAGSTVALQVAAPGTVTIELTFATE